MLTTRPGSWTLGPSLILGMLAGCTCPSSSPPLRTTDGTAEADAPPPVPHARPDAAPEPVADAAPEPIADAAPEPIADAGQKLSIAPIELPPTPELDAPRGGTAVTGPGFAFSLPFKAGTVTFDFVRPGTEPITSHFFSVTIGPVAESPEDQVAGAVKSRRESSIERVTREGASTLCGAKAVELETVAPAYRGQSIERYAVVEDTLVQAVCRTEEEAFEPVRALCLHSLDALRVSKTPSASPSVSAGGITVEVPQGLEPRGCSIFDGDVALEDFLTVRLTVVDWSGSLDALASAPLGEAYVMEKARRRTKRGPAGVSLYEDATAAGGAPIIRQLRRLTIAGGRGHSLDCSSMVGSPRLRRQCPGILASLVLAP